MEACCTTALLTASHVKDERHSVVLFHLFESYLPGEDCKILSLKQ